MSNATKPSNSRNAIIAIIAIAIAAIAIIAAIVAIALSSPDPENTSDATDEKATLLDPNDNDTPLDAEQGADDATSDAEKANSREDAARIVGFWGTSDGSSISHSLPNVTVNEDGTASWYAGGIGRGDYTWEAQPDGTYAFTLVSFTPASPDDHTQYCTDEVAFIDSAGKLHWDDSVFIRDEQPGGASADTSSQKADAQPAAERDVVGKWYYDIDPTGSGGAGRPMYYALDVLENGTATLTYNGMSYARYSWTASEGGFDFTKTGGDGGSDYTGSAHASIVDKTLQWDGHDSDAYTPFIRVE